MDLEILQAEVEEANIVHSILQSCANWLDEQGMDHWMTAYPLEKVVDRIKTQEVYLLLAEDDPVGTITLNDKPPSYYNPEVHQFWTDPETDALYISALGIDPKLHGNGLASYLVDFVEQTAIERKIPFIRFDAVAHYEKLTEFYLNRGYKIVGNCEWSELCGCRSNFYEKKIR